MLASPPSLAMHTAAVLADLACGMVAHTDLPSRVARSHADVLWLWSTRVLVDLLSFFPHPALLALAGNLGDLTKFT